MSELSPNAFLTSCVSLKRGLRLKNRNGCHHGAEIFAKRSHLETEFSLQHPLELPTHNSCPTLVRPTHNSCPTLVRPTHNSCPYAQPKSVPKSAWLTTNGKTSCTSLGIYNFTGIFLECFSCATLLTFVLSTLPRSQADCTRVSDEL